MQELDRRYLKPINIVGKRMENDRTSMNQDPWARATGRTDGRTDGRADGRADRQHHTLAIPG